MEANLSHEEIWDDSSLVKSWDDAVEEYKKYHSIAAKGENVEELLRKLQEEESKDSSVQDAPLLTTDDLIKSTTEDATAMDLEATGPAQHGISPVEVEIMTHDGRTNATQSGATKVANDVDSQGNSSAIPQALLATVQDENMRNLMMSWYYAGYYTGYQEGQSKAVAGLQTGQQGGM